MGPRLLPWAGVLLGEAFWELCVTLLGKERSSSGRVLFFVICIGECRKAYSGSPPCTAY